MFSDGHASKWGADHSFSQYLLHNQGIRFALELIGLTIFSGVFMFLKRQCIIVMSRWVEYDLKNEIYQHYQRLDTGFYKRNRTGDLMNRISEDVGRVRMYIGPAIMYIVDTAVTITTVVTYMWHESVPLTLLVLVPLPILSVMVFRISNAISRRSARVQEALSGITTHAQETFSGIRVVKAYHKENIFNRSFSKMAASYREKVIALAKVEGAFQPFLVFMVGLSLLSIIFFGGRMYANGEIESVGNFPEFIFWVFKLTWPFTSLGWILSLVQRAAASQERINVFLKTQPDIINPSQQHFDLAGPIEFKNVTYTYPDSGITALKNISFTLPQGKTLGIIGKSGSGKSTLAQILVRFMDVQQGTILINHNPIKEINLRQFRSQTAYIQQDVFLFSDTIKNNISLSGDYSQSQIETASYQAAILESIKEMPNGFETLIGERGVTLSGGQKQRVAIARAILSPSHFFVIDDCLSAVDAETENKIITNIKSLMMDKSGIIISHRIAGIRHADEIIVLDQGSIVERGSHEQLLASKGYYYEIFKLQQIESKTASQL